MHSEPPPEGPGLLSPAHRALLAKRGVSETVAAERGYRTVTTKAELLQIGFSPRQCCVPSLLIPVHNSRGEVVTYQARADIPRIEKGKPVKYETPAGSVMCVDVPPSVFRGNRHRGSDEPLFITEGIPKADAGVSAGLCIVAVLGVWNWRGTNEVGGKTALPDWEDVHLKGRRVYVVFDSDVMQKGQVANALSRLKGFLERRGAKVELIYLPDGADGSKLGLDDYLALGHSVSDLMALATPELRSIPSSVASQPMSRYFVDEGKTFMWKSTKDGDVPVELANFSARIIANVQVDDGVEQRHEFEIEARLGACMTNLTIAPTAFESMTWPTTKLGCTAVVQAGLGTKDHLRVAIQLGSTDVARRVAYAHTGWRELEGYGWCFLHAGGALGPDGPVPGIEVRLPLALAGFKLPDPRGSQETLAALRAVVDLLNLAPDRIMVPLVGAIVRAVLGDNDLSLYLLGLTGVKKTALAILIQSFLAPGTTASTLPASWAGTANANETLAFHAKDALIVIDDWVPVGTAQDVARRGADADRIFRGQGNQLGRNRMGADLTLRAARAPRGLVLATGEDLPPGHSMTARIWVVEVQRGDVPNDKLTQCQERARDGVYALAMSSFLTWLAADKVHRCELFQRRAQELRLEWPAGDHHARLSTNAANLQAALEVFFEHCRAVGALEAVEVATLRERAWKALLASAGTQTDHQAAADQVSVFFTLLPQALQGGYAHVVGPDGCAPTVSEPQQWGWRRDGNSASSADWRPLGPCIGWLDGEDIFLMPDATYSAVQKLTADGERLTVRPRTLIKRMGELGLLRSTDEARGKNLVRRSMGGSRVSVLHLSAGMPQLRALRAQQAQDGPLDVETADRGPEPMGPGVEPARDSGPTQRPVAPAHSQSHVPSGPDGPIGPEPGQVEGAAQGGGAGHWGEQSPERAGCVQASLLGVRISTAIPAPAPCEEHPGAGHWRLVEASLWVCSGCRARPVGAEGIVDCGPAPEVIP